MAGYTVQMYDGDWFISLVNIMMCYVCLFGKEQAEVAVTWWDCSLFFSFFFPPPGCSVT